MLRINRFARHADKCADVKNAFTNFVKNNKIKEQHLCRNTIEKRYAFVYYIVVKSCEVDLHGLEREERNVDVLLAFGSFSRNNIILIQFSIQNFIFLEGI